VIAAAQALFAERGFSGATTREIALRAGVTEQVLFNQFGSKAGLFEETVLSPFEAFVEQQLARWHDVRLDELEPEAMLASYIEGLYRLVVAQRPLFQALGEERFGAPAERILERLDEVGREMAALHGFAFDVSVGVRIVFAATTTLALHQDTLLPEYEESRVIAELEAALLPGLLRK
jgi:AcrR family transcriptional regulator